MGICIVPGCKTTYGKGVSMHRFPTGHSMRMKWLNKFSLPYDFQTNNKRVCSLHFAKDDFIRDFKAELMGVPSKPKLKYDAVPQHDLNQSQRIIKQIKRPNSNVLGEVERLHFLLDHEYSSPESRIPSKSTIRIPSKATTHIPPKSTIRIPSRIHSTSTPSNNILIKIDPPNHQKIDLGTSKELGLLVTCQHFALPEDQKQLAEYLIIDVLKKASRNLLTPYTTMCEVFTIENG